MVCGVLSSRSAQLIVQHAVHCVGVLLSVISWFLLFIAFLSIRVSGVNSDLDIAVRASHGMCALFSLMFAFFSSAGELKQNHLLLCLSTGVHAYLFITGFTTASLGQCRSARIIVALNVTSDHLAAVLFEQGFCTSTFWSSRSNRRPNNRFVCMRPSVFWYSPTWIHCWWWVATRAVAFTMPTRFFRIEVSFLSQTIPCRTTSWKRYRTLVVATGTLLRILWCKTLPCATAPVGWRANIDIRKTARPSLNSSSFVTCT